MDTLAQCCGRNVAFGSVFLLAPFLPGYGRTSRPRIKTLCGSPKTPLSTALPSLNTTAPLGDPLGGPGPMGLLVKVVLPRHGGPGPSPTPCSKET